MKIAVISDIHGNMDAFSAVIEDMAALHIQHIVSLGDNVGYGAEPEAVLNRLCGLNVRSIIGNHEMALIHTSYLRWFNPVARRSIEATRSWLSDGSMDYIRTLKPSLNFDDLWFVHGFPPESTTMYLFQVEGDDLAMAMKQLDCRICFLGHTHELEIVSWDGKQIQRAIPDRGMHTLAPGTRYLINVGSVGQPRDANRDAKYAIVDTDADTLEIRHVPYDRAAAADKIIAAGLPETHARRLM